VVVDTYVKQRLYDKIKISEIDTSSIVFFRDFKVEDNVFIIPTKVDIRQYYDFEKDINRIMPEFKDRLL